MDGVAPRSGRDHERKVRVATGLLAVALAAGAGAGCYPGLARLGRDIDRAFFGPRVYDMAGNLVEGATTIANGFVFHREPGDAGSAGCGVYYEYRNGECVKTYQFPGPLPEPIKEKHRQAEAVQLEKLLAPYRGVEPPPDN